MHGVPGKSLLYTGPSSTEAYIILIVLKLQSIDAWIQCDRYALWVRTTLIDRYPMRQI
jgi:hypothetical protein